MPETAGSGPPSPAVRTPRSTTTDTFQSRAVSPNRLDRMLEVATAQKVAEPQRGMDLTTEPRDYINGGIPHPDPSPTAAEAGASSGRQKKKKKEKSAGKRPLTLATASSGAVPAATALNGHGPADVSTPTLDTSPAGRKSVMFAGAGADLPPPLSAPSTPGHARNGSWAEEPDQQRGERAGGGTFMSRIRALAAPPLTLQSPKSGPGWSASAELSPSAPQSATSSPTALRAITRVPTTLTEEEEGDDREAEEEEDADERRRGEAGRGSDASSDADAEETTDEGVASGSGATSKKRRRRMARPRKAGSLAESAMPDDSSAAPRRISLMRRRVTAGDMADGSHGVSEGEGRERLRDRAWRRGASWVGGGGGPIPGPGRPTSDEADPEVDPEAGRKMGHFRRRSALLAGMSGGSAGGGIGGGGGGLSDGDMVGAGGRSATATGLTTQRRPFLNAERASSYGAQKWKQVKNTLRQLRQKKDDRFDYFKSAELMAELRAGAPAVLMLASMMQRDEHGNRRIPVLLEQVRLRISDSSPGEDASGGTNPDGEGNNNNSNLNPNSGGATAGDRHWLFTIELEYGSGPSRMRWTIARSVRDIYNLHFKYKFTRKNDNFLLVRPDQPRLKQPKFPWVVFPYLRTARNVAEDSDDEVVGAGQGLDQDEPPLPLPLPLPQQQQTDRSSVRAESTYTAGPGDAIEDDRAGESRPGGGAASDTEGGRVAPARRKSRGLLGGIGMISMGSGTGVPGSGARSLRRRSTGLTDRAGPDGPNTEDESRRRYAEKQRRMLEKYLQEMIRWLMFRPDSNRLCRFLELSALGVRLAAEGSYHGKECYLHIQSSKGLDFRRVLTPSQMMSRHTRKWFLVRQSYIACVESPENMDVYDVYLVDSKFWIARKAASWNRLIGQRNEPDANEADAEAGAGARAAKSKSKHNHTLTLHTSERKVKLFSSHQVVMRQFEEAVRAMLRQTLWSGTNRFGSFAPVRRRVFAQWLVDGRDYMWNVSRAISMARDVVYIHDWWLSPELYMRRPACISQKWRLDRLLQRKAREGVKVFVIIYRNVEAAVPIDSEHTKFSLLNLHPNIFVQRSPNQFRKNQFFFAHHEKLVVVDHDVAFVGGIDLCFGRWDCPQHPLADDRPTGFEADDDSRDGATPRDADHCQLFPGKDYSNPRVQDFFRLTEPYEEMYDRGAVPRMPWHDVGMQVVGQPARDLTRHFVQRWNYLRRGRRPTRPLPFLLPPPDASPADLAERGISGTCEVQMLRSASAWSSGVEETEASIQAAYVRMIEDSDHFVYIENQFFISSTEVGGTRIQNRIGDALVRRIVRAHEEGTPWRGVVLIPLVPGFQNQVHEQEGTSVRLIVQCQYRSINRGEGSIFGRLARAGIEPDDYIRFFSLRQWGMIGGVLRTEQLYIHAKVIIADDRVALIGSANINERSMMGDRDSEVAAVVRDTDMIESRMAGRPYLVGRFAHTLRVRLMREHLGLPVDEIVEEERERRELERRGSDGQAGGETPQARRPDEGRGAADEQDERQEGDNDGQEDPAPAAPIGPSSPSPSPMPPIAADITPAAIDRDCMLDPLDPAFYDDVWLRAAANNTTIYRRVFRCQPDSEVTNWSDYRDYVEYSNRLRQVLEGKAPRATEGGDENEKEREKEKEKEKDRENEEKGASDKVVEKGAAPPRIVVPMDDGRSGAGEKAAAAAQYSPVLGPSDTPFPALPDSSGSGGANLGTSPSPSPSPSAAAASLAPATRPKSHSTGDGQPSLSTDRQRSRDRHATFSSPAPGRSPTPAPTPSVIGSAAGSVRQRKRATTRSSGGAGAGTGSRRPTFTVDDMPTRAEAEELMELVQGTLVLFPHDWLSKEEATGNWGYQVDGVAPLSIYD